jgi:cysteine synthase
MVAAERIETALDRPRSRSTDVTVVIGPDAGTRYLSERGRLAGDIP